MKNHALIPIVIGLGFSLLASSGLAHHAFSAQFDAEKPIKLIGSVTSVEWRNPHTWFYIDVEDDNGNGNVSNWGWELASPNLLIRRGWTRSMMKVGDVVTVEGFHARDGSNTGNVRTVTFNATGQSVFTGSNAGRKGP